MRKYLTVYVGGKTKPVVTQAGGAITDMMGVFHTTRSRYIACKWYGQPVYKLKIPLWKIPEDRIIYTDDWTREMAKLFAETGYVAFKYLKETRPALVQSLKERGFKVGLTPTKIEWKEPLDVFCYPSHQGFPEVTPGTLQEEEVAIVTKPLLYLLWENYRSRMSCLGVKWGESDGVKRKSRV